MRFEVVAETIAIAVDDVDVIARVIRIALATVDFAVEIAVLRAIGHAATITVFVNRAGGGSGIGVGGAIVGGSSGVGEAAIETQLGAVPHAVVVTVGIEHIDETIAIRVGRKVRLGPVWHTIVVAVLVVGITAQGGFQTIAKTIAIAVDNARVVGRVIGIALARVHHTVEIRILRTIADAALIGVRLQRTGNGGTIVTIRGACLGRRSGVRIVAQMARLGAVEEAVVITVGVEHVDEAVAVAIVGEVGLVTVEHTVIVAVLVVGIAAQ